MTKRLASWLQVQPGEGWPVFFLFVRAFVIAVLAVSSQTYQSALFLSVFDASLLPWQYASMAILTIVLAVPYARIQKKRGTVWAERSLLILLTSGILSALFLPSLTAVPSLVFVFSLWVQLPGVFANLTLWDLAVSVFDGRRARVLMPTIAAGSNIGAILGGQVAAMASNWFGNQGVLPVLVVLGVAAVWLSGRPALDTSTLPVSAKSKGSVSPLTEGLAAVRRNRLALTITVIVALGTALFLGLEFVFKKAVREMYSADVDGMSTFMGWYYFGMNALVFIVQSFVMGRVIRRFGVGLVGLTTPVLIGASLLAVALSSGLWIALAAAVVGNTMRYTFYLNSRNQFITPLIPGQKSAVSFLNRTLITPVGTVVCGLLFLPFKDSDVGTLAAVTAVFAAVLGVAAWLASSSYREELKSSLAHRTLSSTGGELGFGAPDRTALEALEVAVRSSDEQEAIFACGVLAQYRLVTQAHLRLLAVRSQDAAHQAVTQSSMLRERDRIDFLFWVLKNEFEQDVALRVVLLLLRLAPDEARAIGDIQVKSADGLLVVGLNCLLSGGRLRPDMELETLARRLILEDHHPALTRRVGAEIAVRHLRSDAPDMLRTVWMQAKPDARRQIIAAVGEHHVEEFMDLVLDGLAHREVRDQSIGVLEQSDASVTEARRLFEQGGEPWRIEAVLNACDQKRLASDVLLVPALETGRIWYVNMALESFDRASSQMLDHATASRTLGMLRRAAAHLSLASILECDSGRRLMWKAEADLAVGAAFRVLRNLNPSHRKSLEEIEISLGRDDRRQKNAAMELLEETCKNGNEWLIGLIDNDRLVLSSIVSENMGITEATPLSAAATSGDPLVCRISQALACQGGENMPDIDPRLLQKSLFLRNSGFFRSLPTEVLLDIASRGDEVHVEPGQALMEEGDPADAVFFVLSGDLDVTIRGKVVNRLKPGDPLGEVAVLDRGRRTASVVAATRASALRFSAELFDEILETYPGVARGVIKTLVEHVRRHSNAPGSPEKS